MYSNRGGALFENPETVYSGHPSGANQLAEVARILFGTLTSWATDYTGQ